MDKIVTEDILQEAIQMLKMRQADEAKRLKEEFRNTYEKLKPANIIKNIFRETVASPELRDTLIDKTVDVSLVFLTNLILKKTSNSIVKRTIGTALVLGIKNILSRNPEKVRNAAVGIMNMINNVVTKKNRNRDKTYSSHI